MAPTCLIDPDGIVVKQAEYNKEMLIVDDIVVDKSPFGRRGRVINSEYIIEKMIQGEN